MEKLMMTLIEICVENTSTLYLKDDIAHFRNLCQHTTANMQQLENVLKYLVKESEKIVKKLEIEIGIEKLT